jgi:hypothetical protein
MGSVTKRSDGTIIVILDDGTTKTGKQVSASDTETQIIANINELVTVPMGMGTLTGVTDTQIKQLAHRWYLELHPQPRTTSPSTSSGSRPTTSTSSRSDSSSSRPSPTTQPAITLAAIQQHLGQDSNGAKATWLYNQGAGIDTFLATGKQTSGRTVNQNQVTVAVYNELAKAPDFYNTLYSLAMKRQELSDLASAGGLITVSSSPALLNAADLYIRLYLAERANTDTAYKTELTTLGMGEPAATPIDAKTIIAAQLLLRRSVATGTVTEWRIPATSTPQLADRTEQQPPKVEPTPLQIFAEAHWTNLTQNLIDAVTRNNPAEIIRLARVRENLPDGYQTLEAALAQLPTQRLYVEHAFVQVFQSLGRDTQFVEFVSELAKGDRKFAPLLSGRTLTQLDASDRTVVRVASEAVQRYVYSKTTDSNINGDIEKLKQRLGATERLGSRPDDLILTLSALAVYRWRMLPANKDALIGDWGKDVGVKTELPARRSVW